MNKKRCNPKISVVTPSFNQGEFIEETIKSVINQSYSNFELIIIDGGSTDKTIDILKEYDKYITYWISEPDEGQTHAINKGFKKASGDLVAWMNSDDVFIQGSFKMVAEKYLNYPDVDVYYADKYHLDDNGNFIRTQKYFPYYIHSFLNDKMNICNQACFWKKSVFDEIGYLDESIQFAMDMDFFIRMGASDGIVLKHFPEYWGSQRYYAGTKTSDTKWNKLLEEEKTVIAQKYNLPTSLFYRFTSLFRRSIYHIKKGDIKYLLGQ